MIQDKCLHFLLFVLCLQNDIRALLTVGDADQSYWPAQQQAFG